MTNRTPCRIARIAAVPAWLGFVAEGGQVVRQNGAHVNDAVHTNDFENFYDSDDLLLM